MHKTQRHERAVTHPKKLLIWVCAALKGMVFELSWSENGSLMLPFWSEVGYGSASWVVTGYGFQGSHSCI